MRHQKTPPKRGQLVYDSYLSSAQMVSNVIPLILNLAVGKVRHPVIEQPD